jgi:hypothetical protein
MVPVPGVVVDLDPVGNSKLVRGEGFMPSPIPS